MAHVLCIHPWIYDFAAYNTWIEPLGLLTVAGMLRAAGHEVALIDCLDRHHPDAPAPSTGRDAYGCGPFHKVEVKKPPALAHVPRRWGRYGLSVEVFEAELAEQPQPDAVLVTSMMTYWYPGPFEVIRRVRARWPGVPVALGGVYATLCTNHAREHSGADAVLPGPGEAAALQWVNQVTGESRALPVPSEEVLPAHDLRRPQGYVAVQTARGCPYHCPYCAVHQLVPRGFHPRPPERVVDEIAWCVEALGDRDGNVALDVAFYDDALLFDAGRHLLPILDRVDPHKNTCQALVLVPTRELARQGFDVLLTCYNRNLAEELRAAAGNPPRLMTIQRPSRSRAARSGRPFLILSFILISAATNPVISAMAQDWRTPGRGMFYAAVAGACSASYWLGER